MRNIYVLPTDKPSRLIHNDANQLCYQSNKSFKNDRKWMYRKAFNICITNDEEIKEYDYFLNTLNNSVLTNLSIINSNHLKKIILTTDPDLIKDGVQAIDDEFLEWFVKNPSCEGVKVYYIPNEFRYEIIILKEEIPQVGTTEFVTMCESIFGGKPKQSTKDRIFSEISEETKQRVRDYGDSLVNKQETIEEVAEKYAVNKSSADVFRKAHREDFINGAKWQQEQDNKVIQDLKDRLDMVRHTNIEIIKAVEKLKKQYDSRYSEEEVIFITFQFYYEMSRYMKTPSWYISEKTVDKKKVFEKFKKK